MRLLWVFALFIFVGFVAGDIPVHCLYEQYKGDWVYYLGPGGNTNTVNCSAPFKVQKEVRVSLQEPDVAVDGQGNKGFWTRIYDEGVELVINNQKFFAFSKFVAINSSYAISYCNETFPGWYHNVDQSNWGCYYAVKKSEATNSQPEQVVSAVNSVEKDERPFIQDYEFVKNINLAQNLWRATVYPDFTGRTLKEMRHMAGWSLAKDRQSLPFPIKQTHTPKYDGNLKLPEAFDWRNVNGVNYVTPVRNQQACGSCYTFGTTAMLEARIKILSNNTVTTILSPQGVVSCSQYSQGCEGGFAYLVAKYGEDFYYVTEDCFPYVGSDSAKCSQQCTDVKKRTRATRYYYVGGFYGACNAALMQQEIYTNGPIAVSFEVLADFLSYKGGVYIHTKQLTGINPWEPTNHVVLLIGWGLETTSNGTSIPYWIGKNSWGTSWGENGFFRILRGQDEVAIESMAVAATPVF